MFNRPFIHPRLVGYNYGYYAVPVWNRYYGNVSNINQRINNFGYMENVTQNAIVNQSVDLDNNINYIRDLFDI